MTELAGGDAVGRWAGLTLSQRRAVIETLFTVQILPTGRGRRTFDPAAVRVRARSGE